jgi:hypothetical protein
MAGLLALSLASCNNPLSSTGSGIPGGETGSPAGYGNVSARIFVPDYARLAAKGRVIAPQTAKIRLSISDDGSTWTQHGDLLELNRENIEPVEGAPEDMPGGIWTGRFSAVPSGSYAARRLKIELLDGAETVITAGYNESSAEIISNEATQVVFFTTPVDDDDQAGSLAEGEMKFWKSNLIAGYPYAITLTAGGTYPDIVLFDNKGVFSAYYSVSDAADSTINFESGDNAYYIGIWADSGDVSTYNMSFVYAGNLDDVETIKENFSNGLAAWTVGSTGTQPSLPSVIKEGDNDVLQFDAYALYSANASVSRLVSSPVAMELTFDVKTNIGGADVSTYFRLYIDGIQTAEYSGLSGSWRKDSFILPAGEHEIKWVLEKSGGYYYTTSDDVRLDNIALQPDMPGPATINEDFETGDFTSYKWLGDAVVTTAAEQGTGYANFGNTTNFVKLSTGSGSAYPNPVSLEIKKINPAQDSVLLFRLKTDMYTNASFKVYIDDEATGTWTGSLSWTKIGIPVPAGEHFLRFEVSKTSSVYGTGGILNAAFIDDVILQAPVEALVTLNETFESTDPASMDSFWLGNATVTTAIVEQSSNSYFGNSGRFVKLGAGFNANSVLEILEVNPAVDSALTFKYKNEMYTSTQIFTVYLDGTAAITLTGGGGTSPWLSKSILIPAGSHAVKFEVVVTGSIGGGNILNAVYLDDISLVQDITDSVRIIPGGEQNTYVGGYDIQYSAQALRSDGSVREGVSFTYDGGANPSTGLFTPSTAGTYYVTASGDGKNATSDTLMVHPADYLRQPYYYPGTGVTYTGYTGTEGTLATSYGGVTITYPVETTFNADGFFTLEGTIDNAPVYNYAYVAVYKGADTSNSNPLQTYYLIRDTFKTRIWLRFGSGLYTIRIWGLDSITLSSGLGAEGDYRAWSGHLSTTFTVTNTANDGAGVDGTTPDRRFIYPSYLMQSDDFLVTNLVSHLTYGLTDPVDKIKAIHDYLVTNTVYDHDSFPDPSMRKKQDALTVLGTRYTIDTQYPDGHYLAVCEGYANASSALIRVAGIETKYQSSSPMEHGWNHIYVDGGWKLYDATWDDPGPGGSVIGDFGPTSVRYTYFLIGLTGVNGDHYDDTTDMRRSVLPTPTLPRQKGVPDGWY